MVQTRKKKKDGGFGKTRGGNDRKQKQPKRAARGKRKIQAEKRKSETSRSEQKIS